MEFPVVRFSSPEFLRRPRRLLLCRCRLVLLGLTPVLLRSSPVVDQFENRGLDLVVGLVFRRPESQSLE